MPSGPACSAARLLVTASHIVYPPCLTALLRPSLPRLGRARRQHGAPFPARRVQQPSCGTAGAAGQLSHPWLAFPLVFHLIPFLSLLCVAPSSLFPSASPFVGAFCVPVLIFPPSLLHPGSDACLRGAQGPVQAARPWLLLCGCSGSSPLLPFAQLCPCPLLPSLILSALRVSQTFCSVLQGFVLSLISLAVSSFSPQKGEPEYPVREGPLSSCAVSELSVELFPFSLNFSGALISPPLFRSAWLFPAQPMHPGAVLHLGDTCTFQAMQLIPFKLGTRDTGV